MLSCVHLQWTKQEISKEERKKILETSHVITYAEGSCHGITLLHYTSTACDLLRLTTEVSSHS